MSIEYCEELSKNPEELHNLHQQGKIDKDTYTCALKLNFINNVGWEHAKHWHLQYNSETMFAEMKYIKVYE